MTHTEILVAQVVNGGRITIAKNARDKLGIREGDYVQIAIQKLDLFSSSIHKLASSQSRVPLTSRQVSATKFKGQEKAGR